MDQQVRPILGAEVYIAPTAYVGGDVVIGDQSTIMHHVMIRGDIAPIRIGRRVNIQDGSVVHTEHSVPLEIGDEVSVGHRAVVHCRRVGDGSLIGIGAIVLDGCEIGRQCVIAAGTVLPPGTIIPDRSMVMGMPGKVVRPIGERELEMMRHVRESYLALGRAHAAGNFPNVAPH